MNTKKVFLIGIISLMGTYTCSAEEEWMEKVPPQQPEAVWATEPYYTQELPSTIDMPQPPEEEIEEEEIFEVSMPRKKGYAQRSEEWVVLPPLEEETAQQRSIYEKKMNNKERDEE